MAEPHDFGIELADGGSATSHLHRALLAAVDAFPAVFSSAGFPTDASEFKSDYADVLPVFEAARADSTERSEIARTIVDAARSAIVMQPEGVPVGQAAAAPSAPLDLEQWAPGGESRLTPSVPFGDRISTGAALVDEVAGMVDRGSATATVGDAVAWVIEAAGDDGIDLRGRRIVMLGAGAELAPTRLWLDGGADVLWIDLDEPPADLRTDQQLGGSLHWVPGGVDLLVDPHRVRATIEAFADGGPVDVGLYAYAPGRAREWRLTAAMNAIVDALPQPIVGSVAMLVSPTTCGVLTDADLESEARRLADRPRWQRAASAVRALGNAGGRRSTRRRPSRSTGC